MKSAAYAVLVSAFGPSVRNCDELWGELSGLAARDVERVLGFIGAAEELGRDAPFLPEVLDELGKLVPADWVCYCEQDRVRERTM